MQPVGTVERRGRRPWVVAVGVGIVVVLGAAVVAFVVGRGSDAPRSFALPAPVDGVVQVPGFAPRSSPASTTVDGALFVFGGYRSPKPGPKELLNDGVLVAADFASAIDLPDAPFDRPVYVPAAAAVDGRVVVVGISCRVVSQDEDMEDPICDPGTPAAAVLDLRDGRTEWRTIAIPEPLRALEMTGAHALGATSDGRAIFEFGRLADATFWSFAPDTDGWKQIESPGVRPEGACLTGDTLAVLTTSYRHNGVVVDEDPMRNPTPGKSGSGYLGDGVVQPVIASRDLTRDASWARSAPAKDLIFFAGQPDLNCLTSAVAVTDPTSLTPMGVYTFGTQSWAAVKTPKHFSTDRVWTGTELVFLPVSADFGGPGTSFNPTTGAWTTPDGLPPVQYGAQWNGEAIVGYSTPGRSGPNATPVPAGVFRHVMKPA